MKDALHAKEMEDLRWEVRMLHDRMKRLRTVEAWAHKAKWALEQYATGLDHGPTVAKEVLEQAPL